jgi:hypothetical protein
MRILKFDENTQDGEEEEVVTTRVKECDKMSCCAVRKAKSMDVL